ncbi:hypothetical protein [Sodalis sp. RH20]|uniref:competence protein CoiA family protein n=1 Tax=unclassified Sodalis (in: enterobacteria) TaxID=2636512 RepID=UPI0039B55DD1
MDYAINKMLGRVESAAQASKFALYICPVCKMKVSLRVGKIKKSYFAHWPGWGTTECENFVPGQHTQHVEVQSNIANTATIIRQKMELRLLIPTGVERRGWSIELVLPSCRICRAKVTLDLGGRNQTIDMHSMVKRRRVSAELSTASYRILSFSGTPDPLFEAGVERELPGLPSFGAAAFAASGDGSTFGFPRIQELRRFETFAFLWREPIEPDFPDEFVIDKLPGRQGWNLSLVTLPDAMSADCIAWLRFFTGLPVALPKPSIVPVWPFLTRKTSVNEVTCIRSDVVLVSANTMPVAQQGYGPNMSVQDASTILSVIGVESSPAFFSLKPYYSDLVGISEATKQDVKEFFVFSQPPECLSSYPSVELAFLTPDGIRNIVPLHRRGCMKAFAEVRSQGVRLEYLSMPLGAEGILFVEGMSGRSISKLSSGSDAPPHNQHMRLLRTDALAKLTFFLADPTYHVEIEFGGFGRIYLSGTPICATPDGINTKLAPELRTRLLSFIFQMQLASPRAAQMDDLMLVEALVDISPELPLIPHYRSLVSEILASGFELKRLRKGVSS